MALALSYALLYSSQQTVHRARGNKESQRTSYVVAGAAQPVLVQPKELELVNFLKRLGPL